MIVLVVGSTGAGKTTYSNRLARELPAVVYSIDEWMRDLYWQDMPSNPDMTWFVENQAWYLERIARCEGVILKEVLRRGRLGQKSVLDLGFSTVGHRQRFIQLLVDAGNDVQIHHLKISAEERWRRVQRRNAQRGETFVMHVDRQMFDYMENIFEAPSSEEGVNTIEVTDTKT